jgi:hypothetical protein
VISRRETKGGKCGGRLYHHASLSCLTIDARAQGSLNGVDVSPCTGAWGPICGRAWCGAAPGHRTRANDPAKTADTGAVGGGAQARGPGQVGTAAQRAYEGRRRRIWRIRWQDPGETERTGPGRVAPYHCIAA